MNECIFTHTYTQVCGISQSCCLYVPCAPEIEYGLNFPILLHRRITAIFCQRIWRCLFWTRFSTRNCTRLIRLFMNTFAIWRCTATHCITLHHTATHCNTLHHTHLIDTASTHLRYWGAMHCNALQRTATHCNALQRTASHFNALHRTASHCNALHHSASPCTALLHTHLIRLCKNTFEI